MIKSVITNAAEISILPLIDQTYKTGGGPVSVGGMVVMANKGWPFRKHRVYADDWDAVFGDPMNPSAVGYEGLRHLRDAIEDCNWCNVVRVVDATAAFPEILLKAITDKGTWASGETYDTNDVVTLADGETKLICNTDDTSDTTEPTAATPEWDAFADSTETNALTFQDFSAGTLPGDGYWLTIWPGDGDPSTTRFLKISSNLNYLTAWANGTGFDEGDVLPVTGGYLYCLADHTSPETGDAPTLAAPGAYWRELAESDKRLTVEFWNTNALKEEYLEKSVTVGIKETDKNDMGTSAFIENVFEYSTDFRCLVNDELDWDDIQDTLATLPEKVYFVGGTGGAEPTTADWIAAWDIFRDDWEANHLAAAGVYNAAVIANMIDIAEGMHITLSVDAPPYLPADEALTEFRSWGVRSPQMAALYSPWKRYDPTYERSVVWGASGSHLAAFAKGEANFSGPTPGVHYSPAGEKRGYLWGTSPVPVFPDQALNKDVFYKARINPVLAGESGGAFISDSLTVHFEENYSRFVWVRNILNYIDRRFLQLCSQAQHEPDGITRTVLDRGMREIMEALVTSGALVPPSNRDPAADNNPYTYTITQPEIDLWHVEWAVCPSGSARRIAGQPRLVK